MSEAATAETDGIEQRTMRKVAWRLLPFMMLLYVVANIDRANLSFASLTMNRQLGLSATVYGWGAGIFFFGYLLFEVPSNRLMERFGARIWIARIMVTWGVVSGAQAFVTGEDSFPLALPQTRLETSP